MDETRFSKQIIIRNYRNEISNFNTPLVTVPISDHPILFLSLSRKGNTLSINNMNEMQSRDVSCQVPGTTIINKPRSDDIPPWLFLHKCGVSWSWEPSPFWNWVDLYHQYMAPFLMSYPIYQTKYKKKFQECQNSCLMWTSDPWTTRIWVPIGKLV